MMIVMHPTYSLRVTVQDREMGGAFDSMSGKTGCDEITARAKKALAAEFTGPGETVSVWFDRFEHRG